MIDCKSNENTTHIYLDIDILIYKSIYSYKSTYLTFVFWCHQENILRRSCSNLKL